MHSAIDELYHNHHGHIQLADNKGPAINKKIFEAAIEWLHNNKGFEAENLGDKLPAALVNEIYRVFRRALKTGLQHGIRHDVPHALSAALDQNIFVFSGLKTYHQLKQASQLLKDEKGNIKPFIRFSQEITSLYQTYNVRYLEAEYNFACSAAQMAAKWSVFEQDGDQYNLQFRTSYDEKVRASHAALHNTTLPLSDPFWDSYFPPLDWNCRCTVVQVLKNKYPITNSAQAIRNGQAATTRIDKNGVNRAAMFRFNPGKHKIIFPENHPYFKVQQRVKDVIGALSTSHSEKAKAAKELVSWYKQNLPATKIGKFEAKRFEVSAARLDRPVVVNANFYNKIISKYKNDKRYTLKLEIAKKAHELITVADFESREDAIHGKNSFNVYTISYNNMTVIMKVRVTKDGNFLHYLIIK